MNSFNKIERTDFKERFNGIPAVAIDFLERLLQFNPFFRMTLDEAIKHPLFERIRKNHDFTHLIRGTDITVDFENEDLDESQLRDLFLSQVE